VTVELREARCGDELRVAELHVRSWQEAYRGLMPADFLAALDPRDRAERYRFEDEGGPTTVLAIGAGEISALYVDPDRHRGGVGRLLMAEARRRLAADGYTDAFLWVLDGNDRAREFYEGEGWVADGAHREENPYDIVSNVSRFRRRVP
jgi:GNAT superfamily N-acetyltransferase